MEQFERADHSGELEGAEQNVVRIRGRRATKEGLVAEGGAGRRQRFAELQHLRIPVRLQIIEILAKPLGARFAKILTVVLVDPVIGIADYQRRQPRVYRGDNVQLASLGLDAFREYRSKMQIVFQDPLDSLNPRWTVGQLLREPLDLHTELTAVQKGVRVLELLDLVGLDAEILTSLPREISAGRQQRVSIARALAPDPAFIVLDEPTSALTPETTAEIIHLLIDLSNKLKIAYLFISHDLTTVKYLCHRVVVMYLGQIVEVGSKDDVFNSPRHPYAKALLASHLFPDVTNRRVDRKVRETLIGEIPSPITENLPKGCYLYGRCPSQMEQCRDIPQELRPIGGGRLVRCWRVTEGDLAT